MSTGAARPSVTSPVFLLGAGCQKGGTSWLYDYLARSPVCVEGIAKEATVFSALDNPEHTVQRQRIFERSADAIAALARGEDASPRALMQAAMMADTDVYFDYYAGLLDPSRGRLFTMDLTPNYALLPTARFTQIRSEFQARGVLTKAVVLLRDPVDRIWSQVRMHLRSRTRNSPDRPHRLTEPELVLDRYRRPTVELRTRYEVTLERLYDVFGSHDVHSELYERLFTTQSTEALCAFVGIEPPAPRFDVKVNASPRQAEALPDEVVALVARHYRATYEAVAERHGEQVMRRWWPSARLLD